MTVALKIALSNSIRIYLFAFSTKKKMNNSSQKVSINILVQMKIAFLEIIYTCDDYSEWSFDFLQMFSK